MRDLLTLASSPDPLSHSRADLFGLSETVRCTYAPQPPYQVFQHQLKPCHAHAIPAQATSLIYGIIAPLHCFQEKPSLMVVS